MLIKLSNNADLMRNYMGASGMLPASRRAVMKFSVELAPSGTAATPPAYARLLRACGIPQATPTVPGRIGFTPVSNVFESLSFRFALDGMRYVIPTAGLVDSKVSCQDVARLNHCLLVRGIGHDDSDHTS